MLEMFADASFAGDVEDSTSTSGMTLCLFGSRTFVPLAWLCKKQAAVSHSSTEAELVALEAALRLDGLPCLELWDCMMDVFHPPKENQPPYIPQGSRMEPFDLDWVPPFIKPLDGQGIMYVFEDNEAVLTMTIKGRSPQMRHVARTHRAKHDWVFERVKFDDGLFLKDVNTHNQAADMLTQCHCTVAQWTHLLH